MNSPDHSKRPRPHDVVVAASSVAAAAVFAFGLANQPLMSGEWMWWGDVVARVLLPASGLGLSLAAYPMWRSRSPGARLLAHATWWSAAFMGMLLVVPMAPIWSWLMRAAVPEAGWLAPVLLFAPIVAAMKAGPLRLERFASLPDEVARPLTRSLVGNSALLMLTVATVMGFQGSPSDGIFSLGQPFDVAVLAVMAAAVWGLSRAKVWGLALSACVNLGIGVAIVCLYRFGFEYIVTALCSTQLVYQLALLKRAYDGVEVEGVTSNVRADERDGVTFGFDAAEDTSRVSEAVGVAQGRA